MATATVGKGTCTCGKMFFVFGPESRKMAEDVIKALAGKDTGIDVYISDSPETVCSCGQAISLLIPDELEGKEQEMGELLESLDG